jgi:hypothetical protein
LLDIKWSAHLVIWLLLNVDKFGFFESGNPGFLWNSSSADSCQSVLEADKPSMCESYTLENVLQKNNQQKKFRELNFYVVQ